MFRKLALSLILTVCSLVVGKFSFAITYVWDGSVNSYALGSADSLYIPSGTFTGSITSFSAGARITVSDIAIFSPTVFPNTNGNSAQGTMNIYGTFSFSTSFLSNTSFQLNNYGFVSLDTVTMRGSGQIWTNNYGAVMDFSRGVLVNSTGGGNTVINYGTMNFSKTLVMTSNAQIYNYKNINIGGEFTVNGGTFENRGKLETTGRLNFNNGAAIIRNYCGLSSLGGIRNTSNNFYNYSYLWAKNDLGLGDITNSGTIYMVNWNFDNPTEAMIHGNNFTQSSSGSITGNGRLYFYGTTSQSGGVTGIAGVTTDTLKMNDITRVNTSVFYDPPPPVIGGTIYPNAIYNAWGVPDSTRAYFVGCSVEVLLEVPLAISWNYFYVLLSDKIPQLNWSADCDRPTVFEIQRSYDGVNFSTIDNISSVVGQSAYTYNDRNVNSQFPAAYYRIKAIELGGEEKYSQIKIVRFSNKQGVNLYTAPNPFTNKFIINYLSPEKETITIRMFNVSGQQKFSRTVTVNSGNNNISITEAANLANGVYIIQVSNSNNKISSAKVVKQ